MPINFPFQFKLLRAESLSLNINLIYKTTIIFHKIGLRPDSSKIGMPRKVILKQI